MAAKTISSFAVANTTITATDSLGIPTATWVVFWNSTYLQTIYLSSTGAPWILSSNAFSTSTLTSSTDNSASIPATRPAPSSVAKTALGSTTLPGSSIPSASSDTASDTSAPASSSIVPSAPVKSNGSSHVSTGALAGAAIGCAIGGILLGLAAALFLLRRRRKDNSHQAGVPPSSNDHSKLKMVVSPSSESSDARLDQFLLDATPDRDIVAELQALGDLIEQHVENSYHAGPTTGVLELSQCLVQLGFSQDVEAIAAICVRPGSRQVGLRHVISQTIFRSIDIHSHSLLSMLPVPLSVFLQSISQENSSAASLALSKWRRLSAFLLHPDPSNRTSLPVLDTVVSPQAAALARALNTFLHYFVAPNQANRDAQTNHLQGVIIECTKLGYVLLSQPQDWQFVFEKDGSSLVVVCPGLDKFGALESTPRRVVEPHSVRLGDVGA